jgi:WD40 repeat protein
VAIRNESGALTLWRAEDWVQTGKIQEGKALDYAFSLDGKLFAASHQSAEIILWNTADWSRRRLLTLPKQDLNALAFSPDSRQLAIACYDRTVQLWDIATGDLHPLRSDGGAVLSLAFTHDGKTLAVGSANGVVKFWNVSMRREITTLKAHKTLLRGLAFSPDDQTLATICFDRTMRLWTAPGFKETDRVQSASASGAQSQKDE